MNKVININDNNYGFNKDKLINALVLENIDPIVSVPFVSRNESDLVVSKLCEKANIEKRGNEFYYDNILITDDIILSVICNDLSSIAEDDLSKEDTDLYFGNLIKKVFNDKLVERNTKKETKVELTEADLIKSLYGIQEEKGSKSL